MDTVWKALQDIFPEVADINTLAFAVRSSALGTLFTMHSYQEIDIMFMSDFKEITRDSSLLKVRTALIYQLLGKWILYLV